MSRPTSQHRLSVGSNAATLPLRTSYSRSHSHTISSGSVNGSNRVNRRKSSTFSPPLHATVIGAALESAGAEPSTAANRRSSVSKAAFASLNDGGYAAMPSSLPHHTSLPEGVSESAVIDGPALSSFQSIDKMKHRMRRASDGSRLTKKEKAATGDLKCEHCGKAYKHGSCLNKHLWEHTPQWQYTSKLLISKHQQVQLLEAASVLLTMNKDGQPVTADGQPINDSDNSSSPAASGSSERDEDNSSDDSSPPPQADTGYRESKRYSNTSSAYSRSYQSVFSEGDGFAHYRHWSTSSNRPHTANTSIAESYRDEDPQDLAAAVGLLSCSYGTPKSGPLGMPSDVPPVPPLPEKYANTFKNYRSQEDVIMDDDDISSDDDEPPLPRTPPRTAHDDFDGVFGKMDA